MGWLQRLLGIKPAKAEPVKRKSGQRGPGKPRGEKREIEKDQFRRWLRKNRPDWYNRVMLAQCGLSPTDIEELMDDGEPANKDRNNEKLLETLITTLGPSLNGLAQEWLSRSARAGQSAAVVSQSPAVAELPTAAQPQQMAQPQPGSNGVSRASQEFIAEMGSRNPQEAAAWLTKLAERDTGMGQLLLLLRLTDDAKVRDVFGLVSAKAPGLAPAMTWLCSPNRWEHTIATVHALREMAPA